MTAIERQSQPQNLVLHDIDQEAVMRHLGLNPRDPATQALMLTCQKYGLDPILKHALLIQGRLYVTRDGLLHVAHRSGVFDGMEVLEQGETQSHHTAKVSVYRKDMGRPFTYIGRHPKGKRGPGAEYGPEMAVKCAEVMALRRAFDVALCAREERWDMDAPTDNVNQPTAPQIDPQAEQRRLENAVSRVGDMAARVRTLGEAAAAEVEDVLARHNWRADVTAAVACYEELKAAGYKHARQPAAQVQQEVKPAPAEAPAATEVVEAEAVEVGGDPVTPKQKQALGAHSRRAGLASDDTAGRALLWGHLLNAGAPVGTAELTRAQASVLIDTVAGIPNEELAGLVAEARQKVAVN